MVPVLGVQRELYHLPVDVSAFQERVPSHRRKKINISLELLRQAYLHIDVVTRIISILRGRERDLPGRPFHDLHRMFNSYEVIAVLEIDLYHVSSAFDEFGQLPGDVHGAACAPGYGEYRRAVVR